jgi:hypothetical protein
MLFLVAFHLFSATPGCRKVSAKNKPYFRRPPNAIESILILAFFIFDGKKNHQNLENPYFLWLPWPSKITRANFQ